MSPCDSKVIKKQNHLEIRKSVDPAGSNPLRARYECQFVVRSIFENGPDSAPLCFGTNYQIYISVQHDDKNSHLKLIRRKSRRCALRLSRLSAADQNGRRECCLSGEEWCGLAIATDTSILRWAGALAKNLYNIQTDEFSSHENNLHTIFCQSKGKIYDKKNPNPSWEIRANYAEALLGFGSWGVPQSGKGGYCGFFLM